MSQEGRGEKSKPRPELDDLAATRIGRKLKSEFETIVNEPVPDRFKELLEKLEAAESANSTKGGGHE